MTRLLTEAVEVHHRDGEPDQFLWRDRLYVVHEVLARWTEAGQWWSAPVPREGDGPVRLDDAERDWWRVEAGTGRAHAALSGGLGVYDLCCDGATGTWTLGRVLD